MYRSHRLTSEANIRKALLLGTVHGASEWKSKKPDYYFNNDNCKLILRTPGPVPLGLAYVLPVETNPFSELVVIFQTMLFECPSVLSRSCSLLPLLGTVYGAYLFR